MIGLHKWCYDIWGDTVNIASRMESNGEVGRLCVSGATHSLMVAQRKIGAQGGAVLCQEYLCGDEYVVDTVSSDGVHKVMMVRAGRYMRVWAATTDSHIRAQFSSRGPAQRQLASDNP